MKTANKIHYVYKITNLNPTDERLYYIGVKSSLDPVNDNYMGSSKYLDEAMKEIGSDHFKKEVLSTWETRKEAVQEEIRLHDYFDVARNKIFYNKSKQKSDGFDTSGNAPWSVGLTKSTSLSLLQLSKTLSIYAKNRPISHNQKLGRNQEGHNNPMYGEKHQESSKIKMAIKRKDWASKPENIDLLSHNAKKLLERMKITIEENGNTQMQNSHEKQVKTVKETICDNGKTIEENSQIKRSKTIKTNGSNIGERNSMAKYFKVELLNGVILYFWTKTFKIWQKENAIRPSDLDRCLNDNNIMFSNTKISSKFYNHQLKGTKIYKITREEYFSN